MVTYKQQFKFKSNDFINRVYLITGANRGLGRSLSIDLSKAGATVVMLGRDLASLENVYDEITDLGYSEPFLYPFDLEGAGPKDYEDLLTNIESEFGQLDGLIHNAATIGSLMPIEQFDLKFGFLLCRLISMLHFC
jgi:NAD(P)-dependent dehydrogenase (short-subunit alcohol dehydrogenase family)